MKQEPTIITSTRNPCIVAARKLSQRKHRQAQRRFLVEGLQLLHMGLDAGARADEVFYCEEQLVSGVARALLERFRARGAELHQVSAPVMEALSQRKAPQGIVATFALDEATPEALPLAGSELVLVLDRLRDPGNVGALLRVADAVGAAAVALIEPCADVFDPQAVRATMGSIFNVPLLRADEPRRLFAQLRRRGLCVVAADVHDGEIWGRGLWEGGVALVLGNEAQGLSPDVRAHVEAAVRLPIVGKAESLNVAAAGSVLMYAWLQANMAP